MKKLVLAFAVMLCSAACAADDSMLIPNCDSDVKAAIDKINRIEDKQERESCCREYLELAKKLMKRANEHDIPLKKYRYFIQAKGCFAVAEGYSPPEDTRAPVEDGKALCDAGMSGLLALPGIEPGRGAEQIIAELRSKKAEDGKQASKRYLEAAKYYEVLSKACDGPDRAEYAQAAMMCYLIVSEIEPDPKASGEAWAGYKRCGAYTASLRAGRAM
ncbi:MAG: hypothetical protein PHE80_05300 [Candidatus Omnitrophica bacterium]|nr:hypothetical protein [Candidatus Omnitrophota bacterium]MDD5737806.1 hypothetical protein [Candidatus Omnitrophota bacterium]